MRLAPVIGPKGPAPKGQESLAQGKPWAILSWLLRATEWKRRAPSGRVMLNVASIVNIHREFCNS